MEELAIKIENVSKEYRLGAIGGGTLKGDLQSLWARVRKKEDPNSKIGSDTDIKIGERFLALDDISFEVKKGEAVGIIGHNGAGKSTLLKLLSRVTAPTKGAIGYNGRIASMLEVGTGFHPEMTGRENIYLNGAILGMTKAEIDSKIEEIIDFSEVRKFIDTPVKRYSSGMYVKLAFSVAAHLDSEIMIMDEVLAVGDMAFQKKCLDKMKEAANIDGRTVLYVSHNMNTIRRLCDRCIVLDKGKVIFEGDVEDAIQIYLNVSNTSDPVVDLKSLPREDFFANGPATMELLEVDTNNSVFLMGEYFKASITISSNKDIDDAILSVFLINGGVPVTTVETDPIVHLLKNKSVKFSFQFTLGKLVPGKYTLKFVLSQRNGEGGVEYLDVIMDSYFFEIIAPENFRGNFRWKINTNGYVFGDKVELLQ